MGSIYLKSNCPDCQQTVRFHGPAPWDMGFSSFRSASLLLVFGLRPSCGCGLFGAWENRRGRRLRRFVVSSDLDLATQNRAIFDDDAPRPHHDAPAHDWQSRALPELRREALRDRPCIKSENKLLTSGASPSN